MWMVRMLPCDEPCKSCALIAKKHMHTRSSAQPKSSASGCCCCY